MSVDEVANDKLNVFSKDIIKSWIIILVAIVVSVLLYFVLPKDIDSNARKGLSLLLFVAILWFTEATHITITAICVPVLAILIGIQVPDKAGHMSAMSLKSALVNFANPTIYLFFGGFALATALHVQKLDRKIAMKLVSLSKNNLGYATITICLVTALLSMWISNTATAAMMLPLAIGMLSQLDEQKDRSTFVFVLLAIAYSASIGGLGTIVGSPPNAIASAELGLDFLGWMKIGLPMMIVMLPLMFVILYLVLRPNLSKKIDMKIEEIPWTKPRIVTLFLFLITACFWIFSKQLSSLFGIAITDAFVALFAAILVVVLGLATWKDVAKGTDWGVLLLFGGGLALSGILKDSGASLVLGKAVGDIFHSAPHLVIIFVVAIFMVCLTEFTSNTASAALLVPVFATISSEIGMPKEMLVMVVGIGASCAFMLPVATPPNALVFGTGYIRQREMMKAGVFLSLASIIILSLYTYFILS